MAENNTQPVEKTTVQKFDKLFPLLQWIVGMILAIVAAYSTIQLNQTAQAKDIEELKEGQTSIKLYMTERKGERDNQLNEIKNNMLTHDEFNAHWKQVDLIRDDIHELRKMQEEQLTRAK